MTTLGPCTVDQETAELMARADALPGTGPDAFAAVLAATSAAAALGPEVVAPYVARLWFTPWRGEQRERALEREQAWLRQAARVTVEAGGRSLAGFAAGTGPTVLLVHGWGDHAARLGAFIEPLRARGLRVLGVDLPGHGDSGDGPADLYEWSAVLAAVIAAERVHAVVAHSLGAQAAVKALREARGVRAAALLAPAVRLEHSVSTFAALFSLPPAAVEGLRGEIERRFGPAVWRDTDADADARHLHLPALVVHSADDDQVGRSDVQLLTAAWPGARLLSLDGAGHTRLLRDSTVIEQVGAFVTQHVLGHDRD